MSRTTDHSGDLFGPPPIPPELSGGDEPPRGGKRFCRHCGQKIRPLNPHRMDKSKVQMLEILAKAYVRGEPWVKVQEGYGAQLASGTTRAPYRARAHVSRLVWFGLAEHDGERRSGRYRITRTGISFLFGHVTVPETIYCKDGLVVEQMSDRVSIGQVKGVVLDKAYWDNYPAIQRYPDQLQ